jgi:hypothetical protein
MCSVKVTFPGRAFSVFTFSAAGSAAGAASSACRQVQQQSRRRGRAEETKWLRVFIQVTFSLVFQGYSVSSLQVWRGIEQLNAHGLILTYNSTPFV